MSIPEFEEMSRHLAALIEHESLRTTDQGKLLQFLLDLKNPNSSNYGRTFPSSEDFFDSFYKEVLNRSTGFDGAARSGQQMVSALKRRVLAKAYEDNVIGSETVRRMSLRKSSAGGYELSWAPKTTNPGPPPSSVEEDFRYIGNIETAISEYIKLASVALKVEDTTVRWNRHSTSSLYSSHAIKQLQRALEGNPVLEFKSISGPIVERPYMDAIATAFTDREKQLICRRLPQASPLMNFAIFYLPDGKRQVLFGYGKQDGSVAQTAVFLSTNSHLIKEFQRLFQILEKDEVSRVITPSDPEFNVQRVYSNEVLVTFPRWPEEEVNERISNSQRHVSICVAGWSTLGLYSRALKTALKNGVKIRIGIWNAKTPFVRAMSELRDVDDFTVTIASNEATLESVKKSGGSDSIEIRRLKGWGSLPMMWIDDYLYVGAYWHQGSAFLGPCFLFHESTNISDKSVANFLMKDFEAMMSDVISHPE